MAVEAEVRSMWEHFLASNEVDEVEASFAALVDYAGSRDLRGKGLLLFYELKEALFPLLNFRQKKLFNDLDVQISKRHKYVRKIAAERGTETCKVTGDHVTKGNILICGAGPVGLRAAVEAAMLGFQTTVVEKRTTFSRANILMLWERTWTDVMSLGAKVYMPNLPAHARDSGVSFYMGTRELQLTFLKTALLCGVDVLYGKELTDLLPPQAVGKQWQGRARSFKKTHGRETEGLKQPEAMDSKAADTQAALEGLKAIGKSADYEKTYKCNAMEYAEVCQDFVNGDADAHEEDEVRIPFDTYIIAEGEWSNTTKKLGFNKSVDKFAQALGLVINMTYDKSDTTQQRLRSCAGQKQELTEAGIVYESMEYLKGETHYIVIAIKKETLLTYGALREDKPSSKLLLQASNLDIEKLKDLGRMIANACGLPQHVEFYPHNPVQLFDYSSRARCMECVKLLHGAGPNAAGKLTTANRSDVTAATEAAASGVGGKPALVMPVGDALMEPFWPQGLGSNRGFHTALNAVFASLWARDCSFEEGVAEARFAYRMILMTAFSRNDLLPYETWTVDPMSRFVKDLMGLARDRIRKHASEEDELPNRIAMLPMTQYG